MILCALLDLGGLLGILVAISSFKANPLFTHWEWVCFTAVAYLSLGWLFGSYTVLRWRRLPIRSVIQRVLITGLATLVVTALARLLLNPAVTVWVVHRSTQIQWLSLLVLWSMIMRGLLRLGTLLPDLPQLLLAAPDEEARLILEAWRLTPPRLPLRWLPLQEAMEIQAPVILAVSPSLNLDPQSHLLLEQLESRDPRDVRLTTTLALLERQLERLPPSLLPEPWISYEDLPCNKIFSLQRQLKRVADLVLSVLLLSATSPLILVASLCIWLEDRGHVFYVQERSGWLGQTFKVYKLRTMKVCAPHSPACWTEPGDQRITRVGAFLRKLRLDELPQLFQVLSGQMSLIGPRPERPDLEYELEARIPHYRKRHWMRPGLSGWAQVCAPYASSVEDSELKLSYDLFYLKNFGLWIDVVIMFRTIKTVLKATGR